MALHTAGFMGTINEYEEAQRFALLSPHTVMGPDDLEVTPDGSTLALSIAPGICMVAGVHIENTSAIRITFPRTGSTRWEIVGLRVTWGESASVEVFTKTGTSSAAPALENSPGEVVEYPLAQVRVNPTYYTIPAGDMFDLRAWGGVGGAYVMNQDYYLERVQLPVGAEIRVRIALHQVVGRDGDDTLTTLVDDQLRAWKAFVPNLYNSRGQMVTASIYWKDGRYQIVDGVCRIVVRLGLYGTIGNWTNEERVPYGLSLPVPVGNQMTDQWMDSETQYIGDFSKWAGKILCRENADRGLLYVVGHINDGRIRVQNGRPEILTVHGSYLI